MLPKNLKNYVLTEEQLTAVWDTKGNPLIIHNFGELPVLFGTDLYRILFLVVDNISAPIIVVIKFLDRHVEDMWCIQGLRQLT